MFDLFYMSALLFLSAKQDKHQIRRGIPRVSFTRPAVADEIDPIVCKKHECPARQTCSCFQPGTIVIILEGEFAGKRAVCVADCGAGIVKIAGPQQINGVPEMEMDTKLLKATSTKIELGSDVVASINKVDQMAEYLKAPFTIRKGDRPHLMKF